MKSVFDVDIKEEKISSSGCNWGNTEFEGAETEYMSLYLSNFIAKIWLLRIWMVVECLSLV